MDALEFQSATRELVTGEDVLAFEVGELGKEGVDGVAASEVLENGLDGVAEAANSGFTVADFGVYGDSREEFFAGHARDYSIATEGQGVGGMGA